MTEDRLIDRYIDRCVNTTIRVRSIIDIIIEKVSIRIVLAGVDGARRIRISQFYF